MMGTHGACPSQVLESDLESRASNFGFRSRCAFTLIEVLLAVAIFAIILLAIHGVFHGALRLRNKTLDSVERTLPLQQALAVLKRDLANLVLPGGTLFGEFQTTPTTTSSSSASSSASTSTAGTATGSSQAPASQSSSMFSMLSMRGLIVSPALYTSTAIIDDATPWSEVERVIYYLAASTNNSVGKDLMRSVSRNLLPVAEDETVDQWLLGGVEDVVFTFYDGSQWQQIWDSTLLASNKLPLAVKVELQLVPEEAAKQMRDPITLVVPLAVQGSTNSATTTAQTTGGGS